MPVNGSSIFNIQAEGTLYNAMNLDEIELMNKFDYRKN